MPELFSIGSFNFLDLRGAPQTSPAKIDIRTQPGFDGATAWHMGRPNVEPFIMQGVAEVGSASAAKTLFTQYVQTVGFVASALTWQGSEAYAALASSGDLPALEATQVLVLDVKMTGVQDVSVPVGFTGSGLLFSQWTLLPWIVEEEAP